MVDKHFFCIIKRPAKIQMSATAFFQLDEKKLTAMKERKIVQATSKHLTVKDSTEKRITVPTKIYILKRTLKNQFHFSQGLHIVPFWTTLEAEKMWCEEEKARSQLFWVWRIQFNEVVLNPEDPKNVGWGLFLPQITFLKLKRSSKWTFSIQDHFSSLLLWSKSKK